LADLILRARHYRTLQPVAIRLQEGLIRYIQPLDSDESLPVVAPGLVDLQVNGFQGIDFNHYPFSVEQVEQAVRLLWRQGVTSWLPTVITASDETLCQSLATLAESRRQRAWVRDAIVGFHLEGPFISPEDGPRGAHPLAAICAPQNTLFDRWQRCAEGGIRLLTLSPEWPEAAAFIRHYHAQNVLIAIGHTAATSAQIDEAVAAGARLSTHLGNGAHLQLPRHPNYIWQQLAEDKLACTLIADGEHLPAEVLKVFLRAKGEQALLVSDVTSFAGLPAGDYLAPIGGRVTLSDGGRLSLTDNPRLLAGSARGLLDCVNFLLRSKLVDLGTAIDMAAKRPACQLGLPQQIGLESGAPADLIFLEPQQDSSVRLTACWKGGVKVWDEESGDADRLEGLEPMN